MFKKVLIAEDLDTISQSILLSLEKHEIETIEHVKYCDDALIKIKKAIHDNEPYDLLISDLSFKPDYRFVTLSSGEALISEVRKIDVDLKIIVYSIEDKAFRIKSLFKKYQINGYVLKSRKSIEELQNAVQSVYDNHHKIMSNDLQHVLNNPAIFEIESFDIEILKYLSIGNTVEEISEIFKTLGILPNGLSSLEKRIGKLKTYFKANNNVHLISMSKDLGLI